MTAKTPTNIGASIRQRLLNKARQEQRPFAELVQYFAMERFLYRLSHSSHDIVIRAGYAKNVAGLSSPMKKLRHIEMNG